MIVDPYYLTPKARASLKAKFDAMKQSSIERRVKRAADENVSRMNTDRIFDAFKTIKIRSAA